MVHRYMKGRMGHAYVDCIPYETKPIEYRTFRYGERAERALATATEDITISYEEYKDKDRFARIEFFKASDKTKMQLVMRKMRRRCGWQGRKLLKQRLNRLFAAERVYRRLRLGVYGPPPGGVTVRQSETVGNSPHPMGNETFENSTVV